MSVPYVYNGFGLIASRAGHHGGYGGYGHKGGGGSNLGLGNLFGNVDLTLDICPDLLLSAVALAGAAFFYLIYTATTMAGRRRKRRRKRKSPDSPEVMSSLCTSGHVSVFEIDSHAAVCYTGEEQLSVESFFLRGDFI